MLIEETLFGTIDKVEEALYLLKAKEPPEGYYVAFSGGKDSVCIYHLCKMAGVKFDAHYNVTTIDPPELIWFMREYCPDVIFEYPKKSFLQRMVEKGFPQRHRRWCCAEYKERGGTGRLVVTGIRKAESINRSKRKVIESCYKDPTKFYLNIIAYWEFEDVWQFISENNLPYCKLYNEGYKRIGCLFCPMASKQRLVDAERYPRYKQLFIKYFQKLYEYKKFTGKKSVDRWKNGEEMFYWWLNENRESDDKDQMVMFE